MKGKGKKFGDFKTRFLLDCTYSRYPYKIEALFLMSETNPYHVRSIINSKSQSFWVTMVDAILNSFRPEIVIERLYMLGLAEPTQNVYHDYSEKWERELKTDFRLVSYIHFRPKSWERYARMLQEFLKHGLSLDLEKNTILDRYPNTAQSGCMIKKTLVKRDLRYSHMLIDLILRKQRFLNVY
jgi:hypothetical protein